MKILLFDEYPNIYFKSSAEENTANNAYILSLGSSNNYFSPSGLSQSTDEFNPRSVTSLLGEEQEDLMYREFIASNPNYLRERRHEPTPENEPDNKQIWNSQEDTKCIHLLIY
jgi:hypothetical protein